jgi:ABC-type phosphonate transport system ATPase subunit
MQPAKMTSTSPLLRVKDLACVYGEKTLISDISFDLNEGDCLVLVGKSGSGSVCSSYVRPI